MSTRTALRLGAAVTAFVMAAVVVVVGASGALASRPRGEKGGSVAAPPAVAPLPASQETLDWRVLAVLADVTVAVVLAGIADSSAWRHAHQHRHA